jgi:hypothetical protein
MKFNLSYNEFNKNIDIDITKKIGEIQEYLLNCTSLIIYNIEYIELITKNSTHILGSDNLKFSDSLDLFLENLENYKNLILDFKIYDRKRDEKGNVIKDNYIIDRFNEWFIKNESDNYMNNYMDNYNNYNTNNINTNNILMGGPLKNVLDNIFKLYNISNSEEIIDENVEEMHLEEENSEEMHLEEKNIEEIHLGMTLLQEENVKNIHLEETHLEETHLEETLLEETLLEENLDNEIESKLNEEDTKYLDYQKNEEENNIILDQIRNDFINNNHNNLTETINSQRINVDEHILNNLDNFINIIDTYMNNRNDVYSIIGRNIIDSDVINEDNYYTTYDYDPYHEFNIDNIYELSSSYEDIKIVLTNEQFEKLETINYDDIKENDSKECLICIEQLELNDNIIKLPCLHKFHNNCIKSWVCVESHKCPVCRVEIDKGFPRNM